MRYAPTSREQALLRAFDKATAIGIRACQRVSHTLRVSVFPPLVGGGEAFRVDSGVPFTFYFLLSMAAEMRSGSIAAFKNFNSIICVNSRNQRTFFIFRRGGDAFKLIAAFRFLFLLRTYSAGIFETVTKSGNLS
ncbi:MAG: hypothetical protein LBK66_15200 [Spirochaetaceae bacterium]|jgi:hypothetical protein|nr:hypothetical protein [Spirochaetaceae bacterium]